MNEYRVETLQQRYNAPTRSVSSFPDNERITTGSLGPFAVQTCSGCTTRRLRLLSRTFQVFLFESLDAQPLL
jgi:hypothetical protein